MVVRTMVTGSLAAGTADAPLGLDQVAQGHVGDKSGVGGDTWSGYFHNPCFLSISGPTNSVYDPNHRLPFCPKRVESIAC